MDAKIYNKLVRDQIPEIIRSSGGTPVTRILNSAEALKCLREKLLEETQEFLMNENIEELADIYEVLLAILDERKVTFEEFEKIRHNKSQKNGKFIKKIFLVSVSE